MNGWYLLLLLSSIAAVFSIPLVLLAALMRLVGRIGTRALVAVLVADAVLWVLAVYFWLGIREH